MKKPNITEGEWRFEEVTDRDGNLIWFDLMPGDTSQEVAYIHINKYIPINDRQAKANAQAISAVPEMIEALIDCMRTLEDNHLADTFAYEKTLQALGKAGVEL